MARTPTGAIGHIETLQHGRFDADLYIDCTGFRAELISQLPSKPFHSVRDVLFADRALTCKLSTEAPDAVMESCTIATAHEAGWIWDIGLNGSRGLGCVYANSHLSDERAAEILRAHIGPQQAGGAAPHPSRPATGPSPGSRTAWPLASRPASWSRSESTGLVLIEAAVGMLAEMRRTAARWTRQPGASTS